MIISNLTLLIMFSIIYVLALSCLYFSKSRINNGENTIYMLMLVLNIVGLIIQLLCDFVSYKYNIMPKTFSDIILKSYLIYFVAWSFLMVLYVIEISLKNKKVFNNIVYIFFIIVCICLILLPYSLYSNSVEKIYYTYGPAVNFTFIISGMTGFIIFNILFFKRKKIPRKKAIPIYLFLTLGMGFMVVQMLKPELVIMAAMESFICCLMYFTIENPDMQIINELTRNKELIEKANEDKSNLVFKMSQEIKNPVKYIYETSSNLLLEENKDNLKQGIKTINSSTRKLSYMVNDVLDLSTLNKSKIKMTNSKYNIKIIIQEIKSYVMKNKQESVEFRVNVDSSVPDVMYGDSVRLKQLLLAVLLNSCKYTSEGFIELNISSINKYDISRLIITIEDSGIGMDIYKVNELLDDKYIASEEELNNINIEDLNVKITRKISTILNGTFMIKSDIDKGTETMITLDQKIYKNISALKKYATNNFTKSKILLLDDNETETNNIKQIVRQNDLEIISTTYSDEVEEKINNNIRLSLIILKDNMEPSALTVMKKLKENKNYKTKTIVILEKNKEQIKNHYIEDGFTDYILVDNLEKEINKVINKYIKAR